MRNGTLNIIHQFSYITASGIDNKIVYCSTERAHTSINMETCYIKGLLYISVTTDINVQLPGTV